MQILPPSFVLPSVCLAYKGGNLWLEEASKQKQSIYFQEKHAFRISLAFLSEQKGKFSRKEQQMWEREWKEWLKKRVKPPKIHVASLCKGRIGWHATNV